MKKTLLIFLIYFTFSQADMIISPDDLPQTAKIFLNKYFNTSIGIVQKDKKSFEVYLSDGTELEFDSEGNWKEIENKKHPFNLDFLPQNLANIIKSEFPNTKTKEIEKKINHYKIKLDNKIKIYIDFNGTILYKEIDD